MSVAVPIKEESSIDCEDQKEISEQGINRNPNIFKHIPFSNKEIESISEEDHNELHSDLKSPDVANMAKDNKNKRDKESNSNSSNSDDMDDELIQSRIIVNINQIEKNFIKIGLISPQPEKKKNKEN